MNRNVPKIIQKTTKLLRKVLKKIRKGRLENLDVISV